MSQGDFGHHCTTTKDRAPQQCTDCQGVWDGGEYGRPRRLKWLGHVAQMDEVPKKLLFGWLPERRPAHGTQDGGRI